MLVTALIFMWEFPSLWKSKQWRELGCFAVLLAVGFCLAVMHSLNVNIPNPLDGITKIYEPFAHALSAILG